jgi:glycosyltransferase involved in cell wall biosynthesis
MKILYITSQISSDGGVQNILSIKTNYFIEKLNYEITILTVNQKDEDLFFNFNKSLNIHNIVIKGNKLLQISQYKNQIQDYINLTTPDIIIICDFGLRAFSLAYILKTNIPIVFEAHGSRYNELKKYNLNAISSLSRKLKYWYRNFCAKKFNAFVALSKQGLQEWNLNNGYIIPNVINCDTNLQSDLSSKKILVISRQSYEKGLDRLLLVWKLISKKHPDWKLEIYGSKNQDLGLENLITEYNIKSSISIHKPVKDIQKKYLESAIYLMTSRSEAFPMVLLEAMSFGLPVVAYDCPIGPRAIITNNINGFLIKDGNEQAFADKVSELIENIELRNRIGTNAKDSMNEYNIDIIMKKWNELLLNLIKN